MSVYLQPKLSSGIYAVLILPKVAICKLGNCPIDRQVEEKFFGQLPDELVKQTH